MLASAMSHPTTNTKEEVRPSAKPDKPGSHKPATADLPGTASKGTLNSSRIPTMLSDQESLSQSQKHLTCSRISDTINWRLLGG